MLVSAGEAGGAGARPGSGQSSTTPAIADSTITEIPANARRRDAPVTHAAAPTPPAKTAHPPDRNTAGMGVRAARPTDAPAPATAASTSRPTKPATRAASAIVLRTARRQYYAAHVRRITPNSRARPGVATLPVAACACPARRRRITTRAHATGVLTIHSGPTTSMTGPLRSKTVTSSWTGPERPAAAKSSEARG